jgi:streptogramin lyase
MWQRSRSRRLDSRKTSKSCLAGRFCRPWLEALEDRTLLTVPPVDFANLHQLLLAPGSTQDVITAPTAGQVNIFYDFAVNGTPASQQIDVQVAPASLSDLATVGLYDSSGNYLAPLPQPQSAFFQTLTSGQVYILGVLLTAAQASDSFTLTANVVGETQSPAINLDPATGQSPLVSDSFTTPTSVNLYPLNLLDGGGNGSVTVTPTGPGTTPFASVFMRLQSGDPWQVMAGNSGSAAFSVGLTPPPSQDLTDAQYLLGIAPQGFDTAARAYNVQIQAPVLAPASASGSVTDLLTPAPSAVGTAQAEVPNGTLTAGGQDLFRFRAPADGTAVISLQSAAFEPLLSIYDGAGANLLAAASRTVAGTVTLNLDVTAGTAYEVGVSDVANQNGGAFDLTITSPYTPGVLALNALTADPNIPDLQSSVTTTQVSVGPAQGALFYRLNPSSGTQLLVIGVDPGSGNDPIVPTVVLVAPGMAPVSPAVSNGKIFYPLDLAKNNGPFDLFVEGTSGSDPATLQIGQVQLPATLDPGALSSQLMPLSGTLSVSQGAGSFGSLIGLKYDQLPHLINATGPTTLQVLGQSGAQPLLVHYQQQGAVLNLADYILPDNTGAAQEQDDLPNGQIEGVAAIALGFGGAGQNQFTVTAPTPSGVGVAMVPILQNQLQNLPLDTPFPGYLFQVRDVILQHDYDQHLWTTILPHFILQQPIVTFQPNNNPLQITINAYLQDQGTGQVTPLALTQTNTNPLTWTLSDPAAVTATDPLGLDPLRGNTVLFQVTPVLGQPLGNGDYTLTMTVSTPDATPYKVTENYWVFQSNPNPPSLQGQTNIGEFDPYSYPDPTYVSDILQNQHGHGDTTGDFTSSAATTQVYRFWAINPGPVVVKTEPVDPGVNTEIRIYQVHYDSNNEFEYLQSVNGIDPNNDWYPADRSTILSQSYVNNFDALKYTAGNFDGGLTDFYGTGGGEYYVVVKNSEGSVGQYKLVVDTGSPPLTGNLGQVAYLSPNPSNGTASMNLTFASSYSKNIEYFPIQVPAYHTGRLKISAASGDWDYEAFDAQGNLLAGGAGLGFGEADFILANGPQMVYLRMQNLDYPNTSINTTIAVSIAVAPPGTPPALPSPNSMLSTDPQGNGTVTGTLAHSGDVASYSFYSGPGPLTVSVTPDSPGDLALNWAVYSGSTLLAANFIALNNSDPSITQETILMPSIRQPNSSPTYDYADADIDPQAQESMTVVVQAASAPTGAGNFTIAVARTNAVPIRNLYGPDAGKPFSVSFDGASVLPMAVENLVYNGSGGPVLADLSISPITGTSPSVSAAGEWQRMVVPYGISGQVTLQVSGPIDGKPHLLHYDVYTQAYDNSGDFVGELVGSGEVFDPGIGVLSFLLPGGVTGGSAYLLRIADELNAATTLQLQASATIPKSNAITYPVPLGTLDVPDPGNYYVVRPGVTGPGFTPDGSLAPLTSIVVPDKPGGSTEVNLLQAEFWVGSGGVAHFDVQVNSSLASVNPTIALYRFGPGTLETEEELLLVDYVNDANTVDDINYHLDAFVDPGAYALVVTANPDGDPNYASSTISTAAQASLPPFPVQEIVVDPSMGDSFKSGLLLVSSQQALPFWASLDGTEYRTDFYHVVAPAGSEDGTYAFAEDPFPGGSTPLGHGATLSLWEQPAGTFKNVGDVPLSLPPNPPTGWNYPFHVSDGSPDQDFWIALDRQNLIGDVGIGTKFDVPKSGTPDLKVDSIVMRPDGGQTQVEVTVTNAGFADSDFTTSWFLFDMADLQQQPPAAQVSEDPLGPLGSTTHLTLWVPDTPQDTVEYIVNRTEPIEAITDPNTNQRTYRIEETSYTNDYLNVALANYDPVRPAIQSSLSDPAVDGSTDPTVWGRYIANANSPGPFADINIDASEPMNATATLYQIVVNSPVYAQYGGGQATTTYTAGGSDTKQTIKNFDFGALLPTNATPQNPDLFSAVAVDQFGLKSLPFMRIIQVVPQPSWLQNETLPTQSIDSSVTYDPSKYQYTLTSHAVILNLQTTLNQLVNGGIPLVGDANNQLLIEITTTATASLNPQPPGVDYIHPENKDHILAQVLGINAYDQTFTGESPTVDHISFSAQDLLDPVTLEATASEFTIHIHDLPVREAEQKKRVTLVQLIPDVVSIDATLDLKEELDLEGAISFGRGNNGDFGILSPTFVGVKGSVSGSVAGIVNVAGFDAATLEGTLTASMELDYGLDTNVPLGNFEPLKDFFSDSGLLFTFDLNGSLDAKVGPFQVWSYQIFDLKASATVNGGVQTSDPSGTVTEQLMPGDSQVGTLTLAPSPDLVIDPSTGDALYTQVLDAGSGTTFLGNLAFSRRQNGVWSALTTLPESATSVSNPALALTHDQPGTPAVVVYNAVDSSNPAGLTVNQYLTGQAVRWRYFDGTSWGSEQTLAPAGNYNTSPVVSFNANGQGVAAWVDNTNPNPVDGQGKFDRSSNEIEAAVWDPARHTWLPPAFLTNNSVSDSVPAVYADSSGQLYLVWLEDTATGNQVMYSVYSNGAWSAPAVLPILGLTPGGTISQLAIGSEQPGQRLDVLLAYNRALPDGSAEKILYNRPSTVAAFAQPTNVEVVASDANFSFLNTLQTPGGLLAYWLQSDGETNEVFASTLNSTTPVWSTPVRLTNDNAFAPGDAAPPSTNLPLYPSVALDTNGNYDVVYDDEAAPGSTVSSTNTDQPIGMPVSGNVGSNSEPALPEITFTSPMNFRYDEPADANGAGTILNGAVSGGQAEADAQVTNIGLVADQVQLDYYDGVPGQSGAVVVASQTISLAPGQTYDIQQPFLVLPGSNTYSIEATSLTGAEIGGQSTHVTSATLVGEAQLQVTNVTLSDPTPRGGETVTVTAEIDNLSNQAVGPFTVAFYQGDPNFTAVAPPGLPPLATTNVAGLNGSGPAGLSSTQVSFLWTVPQAGGNFILTVRADANHVLPEVNRGLDDGQTVVSVFPDAAVVPAAVIGAGTLPPVIATVLNYTGVNNVQVTAQVSNIGRADLSNVPVELLWSLDNGAFQKVTDTSIALLPAGSSRTVTFAASGLAGDNTYQVVVDPTDALADADRSNNAAQATLHLVSFPDLIFAGPLKLAGGGTTAQLNAVIFNQGIAGAEGVQLAAYAVLRDSVHDWFHVTHAGLLLGETVIDQVAPLSDATVTVPVDLTGVTPLDDIVLVIDPHDLILMPEHLTAMLSVNAGIVSFPTPTGDAGPAGITTGADGRIWFTEANANKIGVIDPGTYATQDFAIPTAGSNPLAITHGPDGNLWFTENAANQIGEIDANTGMISEFALPTANSGPLGILSAPDGMLWITENAADQIAQFNPVTHLFQEFPIPTPNSAPAGITLGPDGNIWFTEFLASQLGQINPYSFAINEFPIQTEVGPGPTGGSGGPVAIVGPIGITTGPDGRLWFTENLANRIGTMDAYTHAVSEFPIATPASAPLNITTGPDGNLWFTETNGNKIGEISPTTDVQVEYPLPRPGSAPFNLVEGPDGNVWFTENGSSQLGEKVWAKAVSALFGIGQEATVGTPFGTLLETQVTDSMGNPVAGATITFTETDGSAGAGGFFPGGASTATAFTNAEGLAIAPVLTAGHTAGAFSVTAAVGDLSTAFDLINQPGPATSIAVVGGNAQDAARGQGYGAPLQLLVTDMYSNPVPDVLVTFSLPDEVLVGFEEGDLDKPYILNVLTNAVGVATSPTLTAGDAAGDFTVAASVQGVAESATFHLNNTPPDTPPQVTIPDPNGTLNIQGQDQFGHSVASSGSDVLVGAPAPPDGIGAAYLFDTSGNLLQTFQEPNVQAGDEFGLSVALSGTNVLIGAPLNGSGVAYLYNTSGQLLQTFTPPDPTHFGNFGYSVALAGNDVLIGGALNDQVLGEGAVYLFNTSGQLLQTIQAPNPTGGDEFGQSVALSRSDLLVGSPGVNNGQGAAYLFNTSAQLVTTFPDPRATNDDNFGFAVTLSANSVLVGAPGENTDQGRAYLFNYSGKSRQTFFDPSANNNLFGTSVAFAGGEVLVGAEDDYSYYQGAAYLFDSSGNVLQIFLDPNATSFDDFGIAVAASTNQLTTTIVIGADGVDGQGAAYLYHDPLLLSAAPVNQSAIVGTSFGGPLHVVAEDASGNPLAGVPVTFTVSTPAADGAGATFPDGSSAVTVFTNDDGEAIAPELTATDVAGPFTVTAAMGNVSTTFSLTSVPAAPAAITAVGGDGQNARIGFSYGARLQAKVTDPFGNPEAGVPVLFSAPGTGASVNFDALPMVLTNALGIATSPEMSASHIVGSFNVTGTIAGFPATGAATFGLTNTDIPAVIRSVNGNPQQATVNTSYAKLLQVRVTDVDGEPVIGTTVFFALPSSGPGGTLAGPAAVVTDSHGMATSPILTANTIAGAFTLKAWVVGVATPAKFTLTNIPAAPAKITAVAGTPQSAAVHHKYTQALEAQVTDVFGNVIGGVKVSFSVPIAGASGTFAGKATVTAVTAADGVAIAPAFTANSQTGSFTAIASASGVSTAASFRLTNLPASAAKRPTSSGAPHGTAHRAAAHRAPTNTHDVNDLDAWGTDIWEDPFLQVKAKKRAL